MHYPHQEFLADYLAMSKPLFPEIHNLPAHKKERLTQAFFHGKYGIGSPMAEDRFGQMRAAISVLESKATDFLDLGLIVQIAPKDPAKTSVRVRHSAILAAHELANVRGIAQPTLEQIKAVLPLFEEYGAN